LRNFRVGAAGSGYGGGMASPSSKSSPSAYPEFAVRRETISRYFEPPLPRSTFHDFVNKGTIVAMKGIRGFYLLNASLRRLGLREVPALPEEPVPLSTEDLVRFAFCVMDSDLFPAPSWLLGAGALDSRDADHVVLLIDKHQAAVVGLESDRLKQAYLQGVLDALHALKTGPTAEVADGPEE
jgi:hypothetical protein